MFCLWIIFTSVPAIIINIREDNAEQWDESPVLVQRLCLGNHGKNSKNYQEEDNEINSIVIINAFFMLVLYVLSLMFDMYQNSKNVEIDQHIISAGDFTVLISNLPRDINEIRLK